MKFFKHYLLIHLLAKSGFKKVRRQEREGRTPLFCLPAVVNGGEELCKTGRLLVRSGVRWVLTGSAGSMGYISTVMKNEMPLFASLLKVFEQDPFSPPAACRTG